MALWDRYSYVKGDTGGTERALSALVIGSNEAGTVYSIFNKSQVQETRALLPPNLGRSLILCGKYTNGTACAEGALCERGHVRGPTTRLFPAENSGESLLILDRQGKAMFSVKAGEAEDTVGLRVGCYLKTTQLYRHAKLYLCEDFTLRTCLRKAACPYIHVAQELLKPKFFEEYPPDIDSRHTILEAFSKLEEHSDIHANFAERLEAEQGLRLVRDLNLVSNEVFGYLYEVYGGHDSHLCSLLEQVRLLPDELSIKGALKKYDALSQATDKELKYLQENNIRNIRELSRVRFRTLLTMPISSALKSCLQLMRERRRGREGNVPFEVISVAEVEGFIEDVVTQLAKHDETTHPSWRKSVKGQTVTTAITYVRGCKCGTGFGTKAATPQKVTPRKPASSRFMPYPTLSPNLQPTSPPYDADDVRGQWCSCLREVVYSVNYELSTPSGSRCSEQNGLGRIASLGLPTSSIREVFVRGYTQPPTPDPNPLFPCGVCENMFKKLSRDVFRQHGADIMLYMVDTQLRPRKLIRMPFSEISNRGSTSFKTFVREEIRPQSEMTESLEH